MQRFEAGCKRAFTDDAESLKRRSVGISLRGSENMAVEQTADETACASRDNDCARGGECEQAPCKERCFANDLLFHCRAHMLRIASDHEASRDAHTSLQWFCRSLDP